MTHKQKTAAQRKSLRIAKQKTGSSLMELRYMLKLMPDTDLTRSTGHIERAIDDLERVQRRLNRVFI